MFKQILQVVSPLKLFSRSKGYKYPGGIRYPGGIVYYPRFPDFQEPEITPSKLFRVERIKPVKGNSWKLKLILRDFGLDEEERVTVVKNTPDINTKLWKIKHLIKITPIKFPYGEPTAGDINYTFLKENGDCIVHKQLQPNQKQIEALDNFDKDAKKMDSTTIKSDSRHKWNNGFTGGF